MYLLDTNIVIYHLQNRPAIKKRMEESAGKPRWISIVTYGELLYGALKSKYSEYNLARVRNIGAAFPIAPLDEPAMAAYADLRLSLERKGGMLDDLDLLIAATALSNGFCLVTNDRHFSRIRGLAIENWAE